MNVLVTGGTGFVGRYFVTELLQQGHRVTVVGRRERRDVPWLRAVEFHPLDISNPIENPFELLGRPDAAVHLAWTDLPNYGASLHIEKNLPASKNFLTSLVSGGLRQLLVAGTCFEYGMLTGPLTEDLPAEPINAYAIAKDALRRSLESLRLHHRWTLQWARLFYVYGNGQNPHSLLSSLDRAIDGGATHFDMSGGQQVRDFVHVEVVARQLATLLRNPQCDGVVNICSGTPISVLEFVQRHLVKRNASINLNLGRYPYSENEPMACWGVGSKFQRFCTQGAEAR
jgi:dTDP-6-deoxy-L-talose 4-dehydrogenase (NAD+)